MRPRFTRIGLVFTHNWAYCRGVLRGIREFAELRPNWALIPVAPEAGAVLALKKMKPAGAIVHVFTESTAKAVVSLRKPFVNVSGMMRAPLVPRVGNDDFVFGKMAAQHLLDLGFRNFGFVGTPDHHYSVTRETGFRATVEKAGFRVDSYHEPRHQPLDLVGRMWLQQRAVGQWLLKLPRPIGVFTADDTWGFQLTEVCQQVDLHVPEDVSIVGVENDDLLCNLARPSLSSVPVSARTIGLEAARLLDRMLHGQAPPAEPLLFPPGAVVRRRSSDILAIANAEVAQAVRFIRDHAHRPLRIEDVLAEIPLPRRSLERRFRATLGRSILDEIRHAHLERACRLLSETDFPMETVAESAGFSGPKHLWVTFQQFLGQTPTVFRKTTRGLIEG